MQKYRVLAIIIMLAVMVFATGITSVSAKSARSQSVALENIEKRIEKAQTKKQNKIDNMHSWMEKHYEDHTASPD